MLREPPISEKTAIRRDQILNQINDLLVEKLKDDSKIVIEMYMLNQDSLVFFLSYRSLDDNFISSLILHEPLERTIQNAFNALQKEMNKEQGNIRWNKARLNVIDEDNFVFEHQFCEDVAWISGLSPETYPSVDGYVGAQTVIFTWPGLPDNYKRPWKIEN